MAKPDKFNKRPDTRNWDSKMLAEAKRRACVTRVTKAEEIRIKVQGQQCLTKIDKAITELFEIDAALKETLPEKLRPNSEGQFDTTEVTQAKVNSLLIDDNVKIQKTRIQALSVTLTNQFKMLAKVLPDAPANEQPLEETKEGDNAGQENYQELLLKKLNTIFEQASDEGVSTKAH